MKIYITFCIMASIVLAVIFVPHYFGKWIIRKMEIEDEVYPWMVGAVVLLLSTLAVGVILFLILEPFMLIYTAL